MCNLHTANFLFEFELLIRSINALVFSLSLRLICICVLKQMRVCVCEMNYAWDIIKVVLKVLRWSNKTLKRRMMGGKGDNTQFMRWCFPLIMVPNFSGLLTFACNAVWHLRLTQKRKSLLALLTGLFLTRALLCFIGDKLMMLMPDM